MGDPDRRGSRAGADAGRSRRQTGRAVPEHADPQPTPRRHLRGELERAHRHSAGCRQPADRPSGRARARARAVPRRGRRGRPRPRAGRRPHPLGWNGPRLLDPRAEPGPPRGRRLFGRARPQSAGRLTGGADGQCRAAEGRRGAGGRVVDRRLAEEPLRQAAPTRRRTLHRTAAEIGTRLLAVQRPVPAAVVLRRHRLPGRAGAGVGDRGVPRRPAHRLRLGRRDGPILDGRADGIRREPGGFRRLRPLRRSARIQPELPGQHRGDPRRSGRVRSRGRRLPYVASARPMRISICATA